MIIRQLTPEEYTRAFPRPVTVFDTAAFTATVKERAQRVLYLAGCNADDLKPRLGIIVGLADDGTWHTPFSAPFACPSCNRSASLETIYEFFAEVKHHLGNASLHITLPPDFYDDSLIPRIAGVLINSAEKVTADYNFYYPLSRIQSFREHLSPSARNKFNAASRHVFNFEHTDDAARAYKVIEANRKAKGYPLAMSFEQVMRTIPVVNADFFVMVHENTDVAAAMVYRSAPLVAHLIYWGDEPAFSHLHPMNIFPYHLFNYYAERGFKCVDIGPASTDGIPNTGLCRFKESIGCLTSVRLSLIL